MTLIQDSEQHCAHAHFQSTYLSNLLIERLKGGLRSGFLLACCILFGCSVHAKSLETIEIAFISQFDDESPGIPTHLKTPLDQGIAGAQLAVTEANQTGRFLGYQLVLQELVADDFLSSTATSIALLHSDIANNNALYERLVKQRPDALLFNVHDQSSMWRTQQCYANLFHVIPSYAMQADALGQWMRLRRIRDILVIHGQSAEDKAYLSAIQRTAKRFKLNIVEVKAWTGDFDLRRVAFKEIPQYTKTDKTIDVIFVADSERQFGFAIPYNNHGLAPVVGDAGLVPQAWHHTIEQWGARQLQNRFKATYGRAMNSTDFASYLAVRSIAYAAQQSNSTALTELDAQLRADSFNLAAYKGRKLSFRSGNYQLRMPIALSHDMGLLTNAPLEGFLHPLTDLDTLGYDNNERCAP